MSRGCKHPMDQDKFKIKIVRGHRYTTYWITEKCDDVNHAVRVGELLPRPGDLISVDVWGPDGTYLVGRKYMVDVD